MKTLKSITPLVVISLIITTSCTKDEFQPSKEITTKIEIEVDEMPPLETIYHIPVSNIEMKKVNTQHLWPINTDQEDLMPIEDLYTNQFNPQRLPLQSNSKKFDFRFRRVK